MPYRYQHALLLGATGMFAVAAKVLLADAWRATVIARNAHRLDRVCRAAPERAAAITLDHRRSSALESELARQTKAHGLYDFILAWLHEDALSALGVAAAFGGRGEKPTERWLTHREISQGILDALRGDVMTHTVGRTRPWKERP